MKKLLILALTLPLPLFASNSTQLNTINQNIAATQADLQQASAKKSALQNTLEKIETNESAIDQQLQATQNALTLQKKSLQQLQQQSAPLTQAKNKNRAMLKEQIRAAYLFSQQPYLKLLLAPNDAAQTQQVLMYFRYITQAQMQTMNELQSSLAACKQNQQAIQKQYSKLLALQQTQLQNQQALQQAQSERKQLIAQLNQNIQTKSQKLANLMQNKNRLEKTIVNLSTQTTQPVAFKNLPNVPHLPFGQLRGKLSWPTQGKIKDAFGTQVYQSELKWDGILISAPLGQPVRAVATGRVIFAKWMAGYGLLLIVNQGNGYMTLYGRNQTLTKKVGDVVKANEIIGTVGKSGGFNNPGLYFSIRHNGLAVNPATWCT